MLQSYLSIQADLPASEGTFQGAGTFSPLQLPPWDTSPVLIPFSPFSFVLPGYVEVFLPFWKSEVFCLCSVDVLCESFHM